MNNLHPIFAGLCRDFSTYVQRDEPKPEPVTEPVTDTVTDEQFEVHP